MSGFRLRCDCSAWIEVPVDPSRLPMVAPAPEPVLLPTPALAPVPDERGLIALRVEHGEVYDGPIPTSLPMAPGTLERGNVETRSRWTNRALLELAAVLGAILGPQLLANLLVAGREGVLLMPFVSLISGMLVLTIAAISGPYGTMGMRWASPMRWLEAILAAPIGYGLALAWITCLRAALGDKVEDDFLPELLSRLGPAWALVVIAASPALVEEIAFRGMLQGRLMALLGARNGFVVTAFAFTLAHMSPATMPIHFGIGLYLGWLRERSGSLLPGMLVHFSYNAMVLLLPM
jgi:membrane protease YdiL (CAAX protease family)